MTEEPQQGYGGVSLEQHYIILNKEMQKILDARETSLAKLNEYVISLEAALRPFVDASENLEDDHDNNSSIWESPAAMTILAGDLRFACKALREDRAYV